MTKQSTARLSHHWILLPAAVALLAANGRWMLPLAAWLAPILLVLYVNCTPKWKGLSLALLLQMAAFSVNWQGMIPVPGLWYFLVAGVYGVVYFLPFVCHRLAAPKLPGFKSTLVLPVSGVAIEWLFQTLVTPYGSWASAGYTQVDHLALIQISAVTGMSGVYFLMLWSASVAGWVWQRGWPACRNGLAGFAAVLLGLILGGEIRLLTPAPEAPSIRISGITPSAWLSRDLDERLASLRRSRNTHAGAWAEVELAAGRLNDDLMRLTESAAGAGADIVVWSEHAGKVLARAEGELIERARELAHRQGVVLLLGLGVWNPAASPPFENKVVAIQPDGNVAWHYHKARPIAGAESALIVGGRNRIATLEFGRARLGVAICHDLDFPTLMRGAGREGVDVLIAPSSDWEAIAPLHSHMALMRAVENGTFLVRPCAQGRSLAVDPWGRILASQDDSREGGNVWHVEVSAFHTPTVQSWLGDGFALLNLLIWMVLLARARFAPASSRTEIDPGIDSSGPGTASSDQAPTASEP